jgi:hypothetical protein
VGSRGRLLDAVGRKFDGAGGVRDSVRGAVGAGEPNDDHVENDTEFYT